MTARELEQAMVREEARQVERDMGSLRGRVHFFLKARASHWELSGQL